MSVACDAQSLATTADPLQGIADGEQLSLMISLLCSWNNMACDAQTLADAAKCIQCNIPDGAKAAVMIYLLAVKAGVSLDAQSLATAASPLINPLRGIEGPVIVSLLCAIANK